MKIFFAAYRWYLIGAAALFVVGGAAWYVVSNAPPALGSYTVARGNVVEAVDIPGTVSSDSSVDLSFQEAGQIAQVYVKEGDPVAAGQALASLDASILSAALIQANAVLAAAQAKLDELAGGTRPEVLTIDQSAVASAEASLAVQVGSAYTAADDAVHNQTDNLFNNPNSINPLFLIPNSDSQLVTDIVTQRVALGSTLAAWYARANGTSTAPGVPASLADADLAQVKQYLDAVALAVNNATVSGNLSAAQLAAYKADVVAARSEVAGAISALTTAESALNAANDELSLAQAGSTPQDIEAQKATVLQDQAQVQSAQIAVDRASIRAPFSGTARNVTAKVGEVVSPGVSVLSVINGGAMKIDAYVSESDVAKIEQGAAASVTLDAYGGSVAFPATVAAVDTAETQVNGSPAYHVTLYFTKPDSRIRAGMTGNVHIKVAEHDDIIEVPSRLIVSNASGSAVLVQHGGSMERRAVTTGLTGDDGMVEITSGLSVGESIDNF